jgi:hypothetical protein
MNFTTVILIIFFALPSLASVPNNKAREFETISMPSYTLNVPREGGWTIARDDTAESVSLQKESTNPYTSSRLQVIKKTADRTKRGFGERELAEDFMRDEEEKIRRELVIKRAHDLEALEKGTTTLGGKKLYFMRYRAVRNRVRVDAILYLYFPENYRKLQAFYVFFASEAYLKGPYQPDLAKIQPLIASFKASEQVVPGSAAIGDLLKAAGRDDISRVKNLLDQGLDVNAKKKNG